MENKREIGNKLEEYISQLLREALNDKSIRPTKNSGASTELEDILCKKFICQMKVNNKTENINIHYKDWIKLLDAMPLNSMRLPTFWYRNKKNENFVILKAEDFCQLLKDINEQKT